MKTMPKLCLALFVAGLSAGAAAENNESITVHFNGTVTQPTCGFTTPEKWVTLEPIKASDLQKVNVGDASDIGMKNFKLDVNCVARAEAEHISIELQANADASNTNAIANTSGTDNGVGLELFTESGEKLALNNEIPSADYIARLNQGNDNLNFIVKYARLKEDVSGGDVAGDAVFVVNYK